LLPYFSLGGYGAGVIYWGRILSIISLFFIAGLGYAIGKRMGPPLAGELSALLPLPFAVANQYILVRPEAIMLPLVLGGVYAGLRFWEQREETRWLIIGFGLVSSSHFFSPRAFTILLWLGIIYIINFRRIKYSHHLLLIGAAAIGPVMLLIMPGWEACYWWIYRFSASLIPLGSFAQSWSRLTDQYILIGGVAVSLVTIVATSGLPRLTGGLTLFVISSLLISSLTGIRNHEYGWVIGSVLTALMLAWGSAFLLFQRRIFWRGFGWILILLWVYFSVKALRKPSLISTGDGRLIPNPSSLSGIVTEMNEFCRRYEGQGPAWIVWDSDVMCMALPNFTYYLFLTGNIPATLARAGISSPQPTWASDIRLKLPFALSKNLLEESLPSLEQNPEWWQWFNQSYRLLKRPRGDYLYWRRDVKVKPQDVSKEK
jgi:hypothetical protein